jgi:hypothetical protein
VIRQKEERRKKKTYLAHIAPVKTRRAGGDAVDQPETLVRCRTATAATVSVVARRRQRALY